MNRYITGIAFLASMAITTAASAVVYKCDGPDGPIFSDRECGPEAATVDIEETSGLGGVYEETIAELAKDKARREAEREAAKSRKPNTTIINNQYTTLGTEPYGYWPNRPYFRPGHRPRPEPRPELRPTPAPSTLVRPRR